MQRCAPVIARHVLARLVRGGVGGIRGEMGQTCFKALTTLFKSKVQVFGVDGDTLADTREGGVVSAAGEEFSVRRAGGAKREGKGGRQSGLFGLSTKQLRALLVVLQMAVTEMEHQNATFTLIKVVVSRKVMLPEVSWEARVGAVLQYCLRPVCVVLGVRLLSPWAIILGCKFGGWMMDVKHQRFGWISGGLFLPVHSLRDC